VKLVSVEDRQLRVSQDDRPIPLFSFEGVEIFLRNIDLKLGQNQVVKLGISRGFAVAAAVAGS